MVQRVGFVGIPKLFLRQDIFVQCNGTIGLSIAAGILQLYSSNMAVIKNVSHFISVSNIVGEVVSLCSIYMVQSNKLNSTLIEGVFAKVDLFEIGIYSLASPHCNQYVPLQEQIKYVNLL